MQRETVKECRNALAAASPSVLPRLIVRYRDDDRSGVRAAVESARKRLAAFRAEERRLDGLCRLEAELRAEGYHIVAGIDEVGRGALAGPLTAAAVVLPPDARIVGLDDSKRLDPLEREEVSARVVEVAVAYRVSHVDADVIDAIGMTAALRRVMRDALQGLGVEVDHLVVDGLPLGVDPSIPERAVVGGDSKVAAIAAASVLAKVTRDELMRSHAPRYPEYRFDGNKGYGTPEHLEAITRFGLCPLHRRSFSPCGGTLPLF